MREVEEPGIFAAGWKRKMEVERTRREKEKVEMVSVGMDVRRKQNEGSESNQTEKQNFTHLKGKKSELGKTGRKFE